jgi:hypothetical protein
MRMRQMSRVGQCCSAQHYRAVNVGQTIRLFAQQQLVGCAEVRSASIANDALHFVQHILRPCKSRVTARTRQHTPSGAGNYRRQEEGVVPSGVGYGVLISRVGKRFYRLPTLVLTVSAWILLDNRKQTGA